MIEAKSFPARAPARKYLQLHAGSFDRHVMGMRDERLSTMTYIWIIPSDRADLEKDLCELKLMRSRELAFLIVDLERHKTLGDLCQEPDYVVEMTASLYLRAEHRRLYESILHIKAVIEERLASME